MSTRGSSAGTPKHTVPFTTKDRWEANTPHALGVWQLKTTLPMAGAIPWLVAAVKQKPPCPAECHGPGLCSPPATPPPSAQDDYRAAEDEKQTNNNIPPLTPKKAQTYQLPSSKRSTMLNRTGQDRTAKPLGGGKVSKRQGGERGPMLYGEGSEQASRICDGNAGGGQGQMSMDSSPKVQPPPALSTHLFLEGY